MITLAVVFEALIGKSPTWADQIIADVGIDSRTMIPGSMFIAIPGESVDGHDFLGDAFANGASYALVEHPVSPDIRVIDLRSDSKPDLKEEIEVPFCILVENTIEALQRIAVADGTAQGPQISTHYFRSVSVIIHLCRDRNGVPQYNTVFIDNCDSAELGAGCFTE